MKPQSAQRETLCLKRNSYITRGHNKTNNFRHRGRRTICIIFWQLESFSVYSVVNFDERIKEEAI